MCALWPHRSSHHYAISFCSISLSLSFYQPLCPCVRGQTIFASKYVFKYPAHPKFGPTLNAHTHTPPLHRFHSIYSTNEFRVRNVLLMQITGEPKAKKKKKLVAGHRTGLSDCKYCLFSAFTAPTTVLHQRNAKKRVKPPSSSSPYRTVEFVCVHIVSICLL